MLALLITALLSGSAFGNITTALWVYSTPEFENYTHVGAVLGSSSDRTTIEFTVERDAAYSSTASITSHPPETFTLGGLTYVEYTATATIEGYTTATLAVVCSRANEQVRDATCMQSLFGTESSMSEYCGWFSRSGIQTTTYLAIDASRSNRPAQTHTYTDTIDFRSRSMPGYCTNATELSELAKEPTTFPEGVMATYALVLTAGMEELSPSATGSASGSGEGDQSAVSRTRGSSTTPTGSSVATGAAVSLHVPALAGIGAVAAFFL